MYTTYFNLFCTPFQLTPDPDFLFLGKEHKRALTYLRYGISSNTGFILVTGEVGTGKTTLIRQIMKELQDDIKVARVNNTLVSSEQLISMINEDFGIETKGKDKTEMLRDLSEFIIDQYAQGFRTTLIIDEAQNLSPELLEEIRLLSNLETDKSKLLQIILAGQPELKNKLAVPELRQLRQRINISCHINPLNREETEEYIMHRLEVAGNRNAVKFLDGALDEICLLTRGVPRLINIFCDFLLLTAFNDERKEISAANVREVSEDLDSENRYWTDIIHSEGSSEIPLTIQSPETMNPIQSIENRLDNLEATLRTQNASKADLDEISARLSYLENAFNPDNPEAALRTQNSSKADLDEISARLSYLENAFNHDNPEAALRTQNSSKADLDEISARLSYLENAISHGNLETISKTRNASRTDIEEISARLSYLENAINSTIADLVHERQKSGVRPSASLLQAILHEIETIKRHNAEFAQKQAELIEANSRQKKSLWTLFSNS